MPQPPIPPHPLRAPRRPGRDRFVRLRAQAVAVAARIVDVQLARDAGRLGRRRKHQVIARVHMIVPGMHEEQRWRVLRHHHVVAQFARLGALQIPGQDIESTAGTHDHAGPIRLFLRRKKEVQLRLGHIAKADELSPRHQTYAGLRGILFRTGRPHFAGRRPWPDFDDLRRLGGQGGGGENDEEEQSGEHAPHAGRETAALASPQITA